MAPRETENNAYAKFRGEEQRTLWYVMVFSGVVNFRKERHSKKVCSIESFSPHITHIVQSVIPKRVSSLLVTCILCSNLK